MAALSFGADCHISSYGCFWARSARGSLNFPLKRSKSHAIPVPAFLPAAVLIKGVQSVGAQAYLPHAAKGALERN